MKGSHVFDFLTFYEAQYKEELERKKEIDQSVSYPTTLITILIGVAFYFYQGYNPDEADNLAKILLMITIGLFGSSIALGMIFLMKMYLSTFKKYLYLPTPAQLNIREKELFIHYKTFYKKTEPIKWRKKTVTISELEFKKDLLNYYINFGTENQKLNDLRVKDYYVARKFLMSSLIFLAILGYLVNF